jgi:hypothetical protein
VATFLKILNSESHRETSKHQAATGIALIRPAASPSHPPVLLSSGEDESKVGRERPRRVCIYLHRWFEVGDPYTSVVEHLNPYKGGERAGGYERPATGQVSRDRVDVM